MRRVAAAGRVARAAAVVALASLLARGARPALCGDAMPAGSPSPFGPWTETPAIPKAKRVVQVSPTSSPTLREALAAAQPGDEIRLAPGTYRNDRGGNLTVLASGDAGHWIRVVGSTGGPAGGPTSLIDLARNGELGIAGSYVALEDVEVIRGAGNNVHVAPASASIHDVIVRRCRIHGLASGPGAGIKVNRSNAAGASVERVWLEDDDVSEAIGNALIDGVGVRKAVARGNHLHDNAKGSHGIFFKGGSSEVLIESNLVQRIRGNAAIQLGGDTGAAYFDPQSPDREGVDQMARDNVVADCDDSVFEVRGVLRGRIHHNTAITQTSFAIVRLSSGSSSTGQPSGNDDIDVRNNLVVASATRGASGSGAPPQYARNDGGPGRVTFGPTLWCGAFHAAGSPGPSIPSFPQRGDVSLDAAALANLFVSPRLDGFVSVSDAFAGLRPSAKSPAVGAGAADALWVPFDAAGARRPPSGPTMGALEPAR